MSSEYHQRAAVIVALRAGRSPIEIINFFKLPRSTVYRIAQQFEESGQSLEPARKPHASRSNMKRDAAFLEQLQVRIDEDPSVSMWKLAQQLNISEATIRKAVHEDLRYKSYSLKVHQLLTAPQKAKRLARCELLLSSLKHKAAGHICFFSDEKIFVVDSKINRRNDRWLCQDPENVPVKMTTKHPALVMVLGVVSSLGHVMPPHFFEKGKSVNKDTYLKVLQEVVKPWIEEVASGRPYVFQQDSALAHTAHVVMNWLQDNLDMVWTPDFWPPNSPDLNPLDYFIWGIVERVSNKKPHNSLDSLRQAVRAAMENLSGDHVIAACSRFRPQIESRHSSRWQLH